MLGEEGGQETGHELSSGNRISLGESLSFVSLESSLMFHSLAEPVFAILKMILVHDHFLVHDSVINKEAMDTSVSPEARSHKGMLHISGPFVEEEAEHEKRYQDK